MSTLSPTHTHLLSPAHHSSPARLPLLSLPDPYAAAAILSPSLTSPHRCQLRQSCVLLADMEESAQPKPANPSEPELSSDPPKGVGMNADGWCRGRRREIRLRQWEWGRIRHARAPLASAAPAGPAGEPPGGTR